MTQKPIPFVDLKSQYRSLKKELKAPLNSVLTSAYFIKGPTLETFEQNFAKYIGTKYSVGVASGTDALLISLRVLGIGEGDEVILPANTFVATVYAVIYTKATPVFVDADPDTFTIDVNLIEQSITKKTKAIIPVQLYGQNADMDKVLKIAHKHKIAVLEDACQAHGSRYKKLRSGNIGNIAAFSFYPGKNLGAYGDGGAITTNSIELAEKCKQLREYGGITKYEYDNIGYNSRLDALQSAVLTVKLKHLDAWNRKRVKAANYYTKKINRVLPFIKTPVVTKNSTHVFHLYVVRTPKRDELLAYLGSHGISTGIHYPVPLHMQRSLKFLGYKKGDFPVTETLSSEILSLPMFPELSTQQQDRIIRTMENFFSDKQL